MAVGLDEFEDEGLPEIKRNHHKATVLRIPPDINDILIKKGISTPINGVLLFEWNNNAHRLEVKLWNKDIEPEKDKPRYRHLCYLTGKIDTLKRTKLHYRKGVLTKVHRG